MSDRQVPAVEGSNTCQDSSLLARSTKGATYLILLQVGSRALTFLVNQILLRFLSPEVLGISSQLELYSISVLFFARESLRVALQRQEDGLIDMPAKQDGQSSIPQDSKAQEVINVSYIAIALGLPLATILASLYLRNADIVVLNTPFIRLSLNLCVVATILELCSEPCFALAQQRMDYGTRASAETLATFTRCVFTCGTAAWASKKDIVAGALPFAIGQLGYAFVLNIVYLARIAPCSAQNSFSIFVKPLEVASSSLILNRVSKSRLNLAGNIYAQSMFKHLLTSGDAFLVAAFTSLQSQGAYTLAANYGGLIARMVFQPIEESSRSLFGRLLHRPAPSSSTSRHAVPKRNRDSRTQLVQAVAYLTTLLRSYLILSVIMMAVGPTIAPILLRIVAGSRWSQSEASSVLAAYCYYIPLLALNGILEAFVSAAATPAELRVQSAWMVAFSAVFASTGFLVLKVWEQGARGLVVANGVNMLCRIAWSWHFVDTHLRREGTRIKYTDVVPSLGLVLSGAATSWYLSRFGQTEENDIRGLLQYLASVGVSGVVMYNRPKSKVQFCCDADPGPSIAPQTLSSSNHLVMDHFDHTKRTWMPWVTPGHPSRVSSDINPFAATHWPQQRQHRRLIGDEHVLAAATTAPGTFI
ncbi:MAG: hypothetical protein Q9174_002677 [Haloplaca sp. 1 TL-2023]